MYVSSEASKSGHEIPIYSLLYPHNQVKDADNGCALVCKKSDDGTFSVYEV